MRSNSRGARPSSEGKGGRDPSPRVESSRSPPPWPPLLRRLTALSPDWAVWKNADRAIAGFGDIDSVSPRKDREALLNEFARWAGRSGLGPMFVCQHLPGSVLAVAVRDRRELVELQLCERAVFRGSTLFTAPDLRSLTIMDPRGFRRLRPGSEGLLLLFHNGMKSGGRPALDGEKAKRLLELMRQDPEGVEEGLDLFGPVRKQARRLASRAVGGGWDRGSALTVEVWAGLRGFRDPRLLAARAINRYQWKNRRYCSLLPVLRRGRRLTGDVDAWLEATSRRHSVREFESPGS
jgi:hypothetical protein